MIRTTPPGVVSPEKMRKIAELLHDRLKHNPPPWVKQWEAMRQIQQKINNKDDEKIA